MKKTILYTILAILLLSLAYAGSVQIEADPYNVFDPPETNVSYRINGNFTADDLYMNETCLIIVNGTYDYEYCNDSATPTVINTTVPNITKLELTPRPIESTENLTFTNTSIDLDHHKPGDYSIKWYNGSQHITALDNETIVNSSYLQEGENWTVSLTVQDATWDHLTNTRNSTPVTIGDNTSPVIDDFNVPDTGYIYKQVNITASIIEDNLLADVTLEVTYEEDQTVKNYSMTKSSQVDNIQNFRYEWTPTDVGTYSFDVYATDNSNNSDYLNSTQLFESEWQESSTDSGGGGGSTVIIEDDDNETDEKRDCNIQVEPGEITLDPSTRLAEIVIKNRENSSITPSYSLDNVEGKVIQALEITNTVETLLPQKKASLGIKLYPLRNLSGKAAVTLSFDECKSKNITVNVNERSDSFFNQLMQSDMFIKDLFLEPVGKPDSSLRQNAPFFNVLVVTGIYFLLWLLIFWNLLRDSFRDNWLFGLVVLVFMLIVITVSIIFTIWGVRTWL